MAERKPISKKLRFEVFKRDKFTCQYCGRSAPEVVLEVDHVNPVAEGGGNDILNLVTSCFDCNRGKGKRRLSDESVVSKQMSQLKELQERREQLDMMLEWRVGLKDLEHDVAESVANVFFEETGYSVRSRGVRCIKTWIKKYSFQEVLESLDVAVERYFIGKGESESDAEKAFEMIPKICSSKRLENSQNYDRRYYYLNYTLKALRNMGYYYNDRLLRVFIFENVRNNDDFERVKECLKTSLNWDTFCKAMSDEFDSLL